MTPSLLHPTTAWPRNAGLTLIEAIATTMIALVLAAAVGSAAHVILRADEEATTQAIVGEIGLGLLEEVLALPFEDPEAPGSVLGPETGETVSGTRALFDDVDDYVAWTGTASLQDKDGTPIAQPYRRCVTVAYVTQGAFDVASVAPTHYKRIIVAVTDTLGVVLDRFQALRARGGRRVDVPF